MTTIPIDIPRDAPVPADDLAGSPKSTSASSQRWRTILAIFLLLGVVSWITIPRLPPGICFDDFGDIQLASVTLSLAHPPGYSGYVTMGHLFSLLTWSDPAYAVTIACFATGLAVLSACFLWQRRFGASTWLALAVCLGFAAHPRFWINIRAPEIYMPTLALVAWAALFLLRFSDFGRRWSLIAAVGLLGFAIANRPPVLLIVPFFLLAWGCASRKWHGRVRFRELSWIVPVAMVPSVYSAAYVYMRDQPDACYNYIELYNLENPILPNADEGFAARARRVHWMLSAEQFDEYKGVGWEKLLIKLRWLRTQIIYERPFTDLVALILLAINVDPPVWEWYSHIDTYLFCLLTAAGLVVAFRRCRASGWLLIGLVLPFLLFTLVYHVFAQSADIMPVLFAQTIALGVLGAGVFPAGGHWVRHVVAAGLMVGGLFLFRAQARAENYEIAAHEYVAEMDLATFPGPAVFCGNWRRTVPMRYAVCVMSPRDDIQVVTSGPDLCMDYASRPGEPPVYIPRLIETGERCKTTPFRNLYRLECSQDGNTNQSRISP